MSFAVFHTSKGSGSGAGLGNHIDRIPGREYSYRSADPDRTRLNISSSVTKYCEMPLQVAIRARIAEGYKSSRRIRKDAVRYLPHILTGSAERMEEIAGDPGLFKKWISANLKWSAAEFGKANIVRFVVHLDEKTPHIHLVTVPLTSDGRLSAKEILGNKTKLRERQTSYAAAMEEFGLKRGRSSDKKHLTTDQWKQQEEVKQETNHLYSLRDEARDKFLTTAALTTEKLRKSLETLKKGLERETRKKDDKGHGV